MKKILFCMVILQGIIAVQPTLGQTTDKGFSIEGVSKIKLYCLENRILVVKLSCLNKYITTGASALSIFDSKLNSIGEVSPLLQYKALIDSTYSELSKETLMETPLAYPTVMPYKANNLLLFHTLYHSSTTYNEARLSQYEMIAKVISDALLPIAYQIGENKNINIQYIGLDICYSHKDLTENYAVNFLLPAVELSKVRIYPPLSEE